MWVTAFDCGAEYAGTTAEVQYMAHWQVIQVFEQQRRAAVQTAVAEHARQADHLQRAVFQFKREAFGQAFQWLGFGRVVHGDLPQLAMPSTVELAWLAQGLQVLGRTFDAAAFFAHQIEFATLQA
ncbi:hypothetical protein D3C81_1582570 [compost metagenome]